MPLLSTILPIGPETRVNTWTTNNQLSPSIAALADGSYIVAWTSDRQDGSGNGIYAQRFDSNGTPIDSEFRVNATTLGHQANAQVAALSEGGFVITWVSDRQDGSFYGIHAQRFNVNGNPIGDEFQVNTDTRLTREPDLAVLNDGSFIIIWSAPDESRSGVFAQRFAADGTTLGEEFRINSDTSLWQGDAAVTALTDGGFVVVWSSEGQSSTEIVGQRFDASGVTIGNEFQINTHELIQETGQQQVAALNDGSFVVVWASFGARTGIYGQRFDANGVKIGSEFQVNTDTEHGQAAPAITPLDDGGFVVTWTSGGQDGSGYGIYSQRYDDSAAADVYDSITEFDADTIEIGTAFARASYGGSSLPDIFQGTWRGTNDRFNYDDDYRGYVASLSTSEETWRLLDQTELRMTLPLSGENFTAGGLYRSGVRWFGDPDDKNVGEALVAERIVNGERTVVIAFRGSDGSDALWEGQTFTDIGLNVYYDGMRPLINAVHSYVLLNGVENVVVAGHSLGGTVVDLFARLDANLFSNVELNLISLASAGLPSDLATISVDPAVDRYFGISHSEDRVHYPGIQQFGWQLTPTTPLLLNSPSPTDFFIDLPNLTNSEVIYEGRAVTGHGFGAEHNDELYWSNVKALVTDPLFQFWSNQKIRLCLSSA